MCYSREDITRNSMLISALLSIVVFFLMIGTVEGSSVDVHETKMLVQVKVTDQIQLHKLLAMHLDIATGSRKDGYYIIVADREETLQLKSEGFLVKILVSDLEEKNLLAISGKSDFGDYHTYEEAQVELDSIHTDHPEITTDLEIMGYSREGREIWAMKISDNPDLDEDEPEVLYTALHHAREPITLEVLLYFINYLTDNYGTDAVVTSLVNERELWFIPVINPDGYVYNETYPSRMWRKNRCDNGDGTYGVDLNRNYGYKWGYDDIGSSSVTSAGDYRGTEAFSEPEIQAVRDFCEVHEFVFTLNYHSYGNMLLYPWGYKDIYTVENVLFASISNRATQDNGYVYGTGWEVIYNTNGEADDWMYGERTTKNKIFSFTPEVGNDSDGFWPSEDRIVPLCEENLSMNLFFASIADDSYEAENLALSASVTASSAYSSYYDPENVIDGIYGAWNEYEWASGGEMTPWLRLTWSESKIVNKIVFYNRCNPVDQITDAMLYLKRNGSIVKSIHLGMFPYGGAAKEIIFSAVVIDEVYLDVLDGSGLNIGLSELEVYCDISIPTAQNLAGEATVTASSSYNAHYSPEKAIDGIYGAWDEYEWASNGEMSPWLKLTWSNVQTINKVILYDRCNPVDQIINAWLYFKRNGRTVKAINIGMFPFGGAAKEVIFDPVNIDEIFLDITKGYGRNLGLSEIEVYYAATVNTEENIATSAVVTASSSYNTHYSPEKAVDGIYGAWDEYEWASDREMNPWLRLSWSNPRTINKLILYDRCNPIDQITDAWIDFINWDSGGIIKSIHLGMFPYGGAAKEVIFDDITVDEINLEIVDSTGLNIGLSEIKVYSTDN